MTIDRTPRQAFVRAVADTFFIFKSGATEVISIPTFPSAIRCVFKFGKLSLKRGYRATLHCVFTLWKGQGEYSQVFFF